jgi:3-hydroxyisobutyrate dehydrogenase-like beta-hydroxyacid dehydrogenase
MVERVRGERATVAILHAGEMGARLAQRLRARGHRLLGLQGGRSAAAAVGARLAGVDVITRDPSKPLEATGG